MRGAGQSGVGMGAVWPAAVASGSLVAQHVAGKATRDTLFLAHFGLELLPAAMFGAAVVSSLAVLAIARTLERYGPSRVVPALFAIGAVLFLLEWWLSLHSERGAAIAVYVHSAVFASAGMSAFWSLVNERFDPHVAKQSVGPIASGGTVGGVIGGLVVWRASAHLSVPMMLALLAAISLVGLWGALRTARLDDGGAGISPEPLTGGGWKVMRETPYLRDLALLVLASAILQALLDWLLSAHATREYGKGRELLAFFALFNMVVGVLSFVAQTGISRRLLEWRGLAGTAKSLPLTLVTFAAMALLSPHLWAVVLLRGGEAVTRNSLFRSAYELFYTPLPRMKKRATKTLIDVGADRIGTAIGSVALLAVVGLATDVATRVVLLVSVGLAGAAWLVLSRLHGGYVSALAASLKSGTIALADSDIEDLTTKRTLAETTAFLDREKLLARIEQFEKTKSEGEPSRPGRPAQASPPRESARARSAKDLAPGGPPDLAGDALIQSAAALRSGDATRIRAALSAPLSPALTSFVIPLLANDAVARDAVRALRRLAPKATGQLLDALLDPDLDVHVRRRIPRVLKACATQRAAEGMLVALRDPVFEVRVQVGLALARMRDDAHVALPREEIFDVAHRELTTGRASWGPALVSEASGGQRDASHDDEAPPKVAEVASPSARYDDALHRGLTHTFTLLGLVLEPEPLALAYRALRSDEAALRGTAYEYLEVVLPPRLRQVLIPLLGDVMPGATRPARSTEELAKELLRSSASPRRPPRE